VTEIQRILLDQLTVLETMTPLGFLEFRDYLFPASGFQSLQFRMLEQKLGLPAQKRMKYAGRSYCSYLPSEHAELLNKFPENKSLFRLLEKWLERTPFLKWSPNPKDQEKMSPKKELGKEGKDWDFWAKYKEAVNGMYDRDRDEILRQTSNYGKNG
jgi:tryptophan 2,3-dioxygenase